MDGISLQCIFIVLPCLVYKPITARNLRQELLANITEDYNPRIPPNYDSNNPVTSIVQLYILDIGSISDSSMDYSMSMFLRQKWNDTRLMYSEDHGIKSLELDTKVMDSIWIPDLYILNEKRAIFHDITVPNKLMHIYPNGQVVYSLRITGTFSCSMDLHKYPLDKQICSLRLESYGYSTNTLLLRWNPKPAEINPKLSLPQFDLGEINTYICDTDYAGVSFTCINMTIVLTRQYGYYLIQVFIPSVLIIFLSWVSFWLNIDAVPARISLGLLTVLTITTQSSGARASLPPVSYVKAIDIWMAMCLLFVFAALIEFAYVNVLARVEQRRKDLKKEESKMKNGENPKPPLQFDSNAVNDSENKSNNNNAKTEVHNEEARREKARTVDKISRIAFPAAFAIFNVAFWITYIYWEPESLTAL